MLEVLQRILPKRLKFFLKPYFRMVFPNKLFVVCWITFRCTYKCSYCPYCSSNDYSKFFSANKEKTAKEWLEAIKKLPPASFFFSGGEPFLYKDFVDLINNFPQKHKIIGIVTNASMPVELYKKINKKLNLNISFHREFTNENEFIDKVKKIAKKHNVTVNIVATPENIPVLKKLSEFFDQHKISLQVDPYISSDFTYSEEQQKELSKYFANDRDRQKLEFLKQYHPKMCSAGKNYFNIMPDGSCFICSGGMEYKYSPSRKDYACENYMKCFDMPNLFDEDFKLRRSETKCILPCLSHCDIDFCSIKKVKN